MCWTVLRRADVLVQVKGQIYEMAICMEDKDQRISDLAKLFFIELAKKGLLYCLLLYLYLWLCLCR
jgi:hypothetical protein